MRVFPILLVAVLGAAQATEVPVCPFTPAELQAKLGVKFEEGRAEPAYGTLGIEARACKYSSKNWSVRVGTQTYKTPADAKKFGLTLAGKLLPLPGDSDGAVFQEGQGDNTAPALWYERQGTVVSLRISGVWYGDASKRQAEMESLRQKLATLRRVP